MFDHLDEIARQEAWIRFIELDMQKDEHKAFFDAYNEAVRKVVETSGLDKFHQDFEGTVYKTDVREGKFVYFEPYQIKRTRREGEDKGSLSMKEAREAGFEVEGK